MEIHWRNAGEVDDEEREAAEERLRKLAQGHQDLIDVWIDVETSAHHRHGAQAVTVRCQARRKELLAHGREESVGLSLREAMRILEREVHRLRDRRAAR